MKIYLNDVITDLPSDFMTVGDLLAWKNINPVATAIAVNNRHIRKDKWDSTPLNSNDRVTIINGAFGG